MTNAAHGLVPNGTEKIHPTGNTSENASAPQFFDPRERFNAGGFAKMFNAIWRNPNLRYDERIVLTILADLYNDELGYAYPSVAYLAEYMEASDRHVQKLLRRLESIGLIHIEHGHGRTNNSKYRFIENALWDARKKGERGSPFKAEKGEYGSPFNGSGVKEKVNTVHLLGPKKVNATTKKGEPRSPESDIVIRQEAGEEKPAAAADGNGTPHGAEKTFTEGNPPAPEVDPVSGSVVSIGPVRAVLKDWESLIARKTRRGSPLILFRAARRSRTSRRG